MKSVCLVILLSAGTAFTQTDQTKKPCISFVSDSTSPTNTLARKPLESAVMLSGDFEFHVGSRNGCWEVHVISLPVSSAKGKRIGYAISHTVVDPKGLEVGHALTFGPDGHIFVKAMHKATADAIRNIRLERSSAQSTAPTH
jgi:hypothetical protein